MPSPIDLDEVGESSLEAALPWDRIAPADFQRHADPTPVPAATALKRVESERGRNDPDFKWLVASIETVEELRDQTSLSLNLEQRKAERAAQEQERLRLANERRAALGKPVFASLEDMEKSISDAGTGEAAAGEDAAEQDSDNGADEIVLARTTEIMGDIIAGISPTGSSRTVVQRDAPPGTANRDIR
jgi:carboxyl-terminal processing protease